MQHDVSLIKEQSIQDKNTECHQTVTDTQNALSMKDVSQSSVNSNDTPDQTVSQCEDTPISDNTSNSDVSDNASNSDISEQVENSSRKRIADILHLLFLLKQILTILMNW